MFAAPQLSAAPVLALMGLGVIVAIAGHATRIRWLVLTGLALLFLATAGMLIGGYVAYHEGADPDTRPVADPHDAHF